MTEDEMVGSPSLTGSQHHQLDGLGLSKLWEFVMDREAWHASLKSMGSQIDMTEQLN